MPLSVGDKLGPYEILAPIGAGGMGEVYKARDTKLKRDVALKVLSEAFGRDPERMARFQREAEVLASLNHPNIAAIYGVEDQALVMELVEGQSPKGPLPFAAAWHIASQIATALEYAHERGIMHRDLKPANVKVTPEGVVKLLDFGLAKAFTNQREPSASPENSPTLTLGATEAGVILGTAAYMAPEQARGKAVDKRADIWSFGVVLYELLTGERLFEGEDAAETLAAVIHKQPDLTRAPEKVRRLLRECLEKNPKQRLRDIGDAKRLLEEGGPQTESGGRRILPWSIAALMTVLATIVTVLLWPRPASQPVMRLDVDLGPNAFADPRSGVAISPDGTRIVFPSRSPDGKQMLATRLLDQAGATLLAGTEDGVAPFFSPDDQWVGFFADRKLKKVSLQGGAPVALCDYPLGAAAGGTWGVDGYIVFGGPNSGLSRVPDSGGTPRPLTTIGRGETTHRWPQILPGGKAVLFTSSGTTVLFEDATIKAYSLETGQTKTLVSGGYFGRYIASGRSAGHLVYVHEGAMFAVPFDQARLELRGTPAPLIQGVAANPATGNGQFDFSQSGTLVYSSGAISAQNRPVEWLNQSGKTEPLLKPGVYFSPRLSPDGQRLSVSVDSGNGRRDLWVYEHARDTMTRLTFDGQSRDASIWTRDGKHLIYWGQSAGSSVIWAIRTDGAGEPQRLLESKNVIVPASLSPDGQKMAYFEIDPQTLQDIWILPLDWSDSDHPKAGKPELFLRTRFMDFEPAFSPDGHWIAYMSTESGRGQVYVRPYPGPGGKWQISIDGGAHPNWSPNGRELFYESPAPDSRIMVAEYTAKGDAFVARKPHPWSDAKIQFLNGAWDSDIAPDGKRFVVFPRPDAKEGQDVPLRVTFLLNFFDELRRRVPAGSKN